MQPRPLRQILHREIRTFYVVAELLDCGHRFESEILLADPLVAKRRICPKCAQIIMQALPPKKSSVSIRPQILLGDQRKAGG